MPAGETSRPQKQKGGRQRVSLESVYTGKWPEGLPDGWVIKERIRLSGKLAGNKYKVLEIFVSHIYVESIVK